MVFNHVKFRWNAYLYSHGGVEPAENLNNPIEVPMVGYGFGIPMSKVLARYLGGDVIIRSAFAQLSLSL